MFTVNGWQFAVSGLPLAVSSCGGWELVHPRGLPRMGSAFAELRRDRLYGTHKIYVLQRRTANRRL